MAKRLYQDRKCIKVTYAIMMVIFLYIFLDLLSMHFPITVNTTVEANSSQSTLNDKYKLKQLVNKKQVRVSKSNNSVVTKVVYNVTKIPPMLNEFYLKYKFIHEHSKRHNLNSTDVRPKIMLGSKDKYKDTTEFDRLTQVPHIIHQTHKSDSISIIYQKWMKSWLKFNPNWQYWFWTDEDIKKLITTRYPDFLQIFNGYKMGVMRADVFRYFVLYEFGGVYADCDMECLKPLDAKMNAHDCIVSSEPAIHSLVLFNDMSTFVTNAFMACRPRHVFFKFLIDYLSEKGRHKIQEPVQSTGPLAVSSAYLEIAKNTTESLPYLEKYEVYMPKADIRRFNLFKSACKNMAGKFNTKKNPKQAENACKPFLSNSIYNGPLNASHAIHHWVHVYLEKSEQDPNGLNNEKRTFNVKDLLS